ncbi:hypothetical protein ACFL3D_00525 [Candidatus Omnitrophota bacterium]
MKKIIGLMIAGGIFMSASSVCADININDFLRERITTHQSSRIKKIHCVENPTHGIILIEDAHCNLPVQREQMNVIQTIHESLHKKDIEITPLVMQEGGAYGAIDTAIIKEGKGPQELDDYLAEKLKQGQIGAGEFLHVKYAGFVFAGIEDKELYAQNYASFLKLSEQKEALKGIINEIEGMLIKIRPLVFSDALSEFYDNEYRSLADEESLQPYLERMRTLILQYDIDMKGCPVFAKFLNTIDALKALDASSLNKERTELSAAIAREATEGDVVELYRTQQITVSDYPQLYKYAHLKELLVTTDMLGFIREKDRLEDALLLSIAYTEEEKELVSVLRGFETLKKMFTIQLTRDEYKYFIDEGAGDLAKDVLEYVQSYYTGYVPSISLEELYQSAFNFYAIVDKRDDALCRNILNLLKEYDVPVATVVIGGFHTEGIIERIADMNVSYIVITPDIAHIDEKSMTKYHTVMQDFWDGVDE